MSDWLLGLRCPDCGEKFSEDDRICPHCGADLEEPLEEGDRHSMAKQYMDKAKKIYDRNWNNEEALSNIDIALQFDPDSAEAHNLRGLILDTIGETEQAILSYREAIRLNPGFVDARANLRDAETESFVAQDREPVLFPISGEKEDGRSRNIVGLISLALILILTAGAVFFYMKYGYDILRPKASVIFAPDYSQVTTVDSAVLEQTAETLTLRAHYFGYTGISFVVSTDNQIIGEVPEHLVETLIEKISPIGLLELVNFGETALPAGTVIHTDLANPYIQQSTDEKQWHTVMTNEDIGGASAIEGQMGGFQISFFLTESSSKIFADYTTANKNTYLGIVLDKVVISAPIIQNPILNGQGVIAGAFTKEEAEELAVILRTIPLPIPIKLVRTDK